MNKEQTNSKNQGFREEVDNMQLRLCTKIPFACSCQPYFIGPLPFIVYPELDPIPGFLTTPRMEE